MTTETIDIIVKFSITYDEELPDSKERATLIAIENAVEDCWETETSSGVKVKALNARLKQ